MFRLVSTSGPPCGARGGPAALHDNGITTPAFDGMLNTVREQLLVMTHTPNWRRLGTDAAFRDRMRKRATVIRAIRAFFDVRGFVEAETPRLVRYPGMEPNLSPMEVTFGGPDGSLVEGRLITSPEYALKKLLAGGMERVFELSRAFRGDEPWSGLHNPEFMMLEWYRANADYEDIMCDTEEMVVEVARSVTGGTTVTYRGTEIDLSAPWDRVSVAEAFRTHCDLDLMKAIDDAEWFRSEARNRDCEVLDDESFDDVFFRLFLRDIEPKLGLGKPVFLYDYPAQMASLARLKAGEPRLAERFEAYVGGIELCNAFSELTNAQEQRDRLEKEQKERGAAGKPVYGVDEDFLEAVGMMPASGGVAFGVDRLVLLLTDASSIDDVLFFPAKDIFT